MKAMVLISILRAFAEVVRVIAEIKIVSIATSFEASLCFLAARIMQIMRPIAEMMRVTVFVLIAFGVAVLLLSLVSGTRGTSSSFSS